MSYKMHSKAKNLRFGLLCIYCLHVAVYIMVVGNEEVSIVWWPSLTKYVRENLKRKLLHLMQKWNLISINIISEFLYYFYLVYILYYWQKANYEFPLINKWGVLLFQRLYVKQFRNLLLRTLIKCWITATDYWKKVFWKLIQMYAHCILIIHIMKISILP